jgi:hypothetical protein
MSPLCAAPRSQPISTSTNCVPLSGHAAAPSRSPSSAFITIRRTKLATGRSSRAAAASTRALSSASIGTLNYGPRSSRIEILSHATLSAIGNARRMVAIRLVDPHIRDVLNKQI